MHGVCVFATWSRAFHVEVDIRKAQEENICIFVQMNYVLFFFFFFFFFLDVFEPGGLSLSPPPLLTSYTTHLRRCFSPACFLTFPQAVSVHPHRTSSESRQLRRHPESAIFFPVGGLSKTKECPSSPFLATAKSEGDGGRREEQGSIVREIASG